MKKLLSVLLVLGMVQWASGQTSIRKVKIGELQKMIDTSSVPLVVNFWATWCGPCIREIPWFEKGVGALKDKKVKLLLVSIDFPAEFPKGITEFAKKQGYISQIVWLNETNTDYFCPKIDKSWDGTIPVTLMVNNSRKYWAFYKQQLPEALLQQELQKLVE